MKGFIMKQLILVTIGFGVIIALGIGLNRANTSPDSPVNTLAAPASAPAPQVWLKAANPPAELSTSTANRSSRSSGSAPAAVETESERAFREAIATLLSPQSTFTQKQAVWKQLKEAGQMDDAIAELERRVAGNPDSVEDAVALAQAYLKKCGQTDDIRQKAMLAMTADQLLDTALSADPSNWEAQFDKVSSMARWPLELNQGPKVLQQFQTLMQEQESQPAQSQFALTYVRLGDFYERTGDVNEAVQVWQRGAALFPGNTDLSSKLSPAP
jgi:tetratricopeptide (TPR) repeat protein